MQSELNVDQCEVNRMATANFYRHRLHWSTTKREE